MGVIVWREKPTFADEILQVGSFGGVDVCSVVLRADQWQLLLFHSFPGGQGRIWDAPVPCFSQADAQIMAESVIEEFLGEIGYVPMAEVELPLLLTWRRKQIGNRMVTAGYIGKTEVCHVFDPGYHGAEVWIVRVLPSFPGGPTTITTADVFSTADEAKDVAQCLYDRFLLETRLKGVKPKERTAVDLGNADIIANGYATFRNGGAA